MKGPGRIFSTAGPKEAFWVRVACVAALAVLLGAVSCVWYDLGFVMSSLAAGSFGFPDCRRS